MAKAKAICKCAHCGKQWTAEATKNNRKDADAWTEWAAENYTVCPECYHAQKKTTQETLEQKIYAKYADILPEITKGSEKQLKYAEDLRRRYVANNELFIQKMQSVRNHYDKTKVAAEAAAEGVSPEVFWNKWLLEHWLLQANAILTFTDAGKLINVLT